MLCSSVEHGTGEALQVGIRVTKRPTGDALFAIVFWSKAISGLQRDITYSSGGLESSKML